MSATATAIATQALSIITAHSYSMSNTTTPVLEAEVVTDTPRLLSPPDHAAAMKTYADLSITEINQFHRRATAAADVVRKASEEACHYALLAGTRLEQLRDSTPHGQWEGMFSSRNLTSNPNHNDEWLGFDFSSETARKYMEAAKRIRAEQSMSGIAQKKLVAIADAPEIDDTAREFLQKLTAGRTLRQLYLDLEIITAPAPKEKPEKEAPTKLPTPEKHLRVEDARESLQLWKDAWEKFVRTGQLDDLLPRDLEGLKEFHLSVGDRIKARLK